MKELKCPKCGNLFSVDEADYASILNQVKTQEFESEIKMRLEEIQKQNDAQQEAATLKISQKFENQLNDKRIELSQKDSEIAKLQSQIAAFNQAKMLEIETERLKSEQEIARLKAVIEQNNTRLKTKFSRKRMLSLNYAVRLK